LRDETAIEDVLCAFIARSVPGASSAFPEALAGWLLFASMVAAPRVNTNFLNIVSIHWSSCGIVS
jgi:hypothetical protein